MADRQLWRTCCAGRRSDRPRPSGRSRAGRLRRDRARLLDPGRRRRGRRGDAAPPLGADPYAGWPAHDPRAAAAGQQDRRQQIQALIQWWLGRMVAAEHQLTEKMVFFWHGHWATSVQKVKSAR